MSDTVIASPYLFVFAMILLGGVMGWIIGVCAYLGHPEYWVLNRLGLLTETAKAEHEREIELDKRTADLIRTEGIGAKEAHEKAITQYKKDLKEAIS